MDYAIVGDWGTSNLRLYLIKDRLVIATKSGIGIKSVQKNAKDYIYELCAEWIAAHGIGIVFLSGMAGSRIGIIETDYLDTPLDRETYFSKFASFEINNIVFKQSFGAKCKNFDNCPDVMRGEEMQIFGAINKLPSDKNLLILPGTHSKWVKTNNGTIEQFHTYPSGELFDLLQNHSTMGNKNAEFDTLGFIDGVEFTLNNNGKDKNGKPRNGLLGSIFASRTYQLLEDKSANWAKGFLSGLIIANEIIENSELAAAYPKVVLIGAKNLCENYATALDRFSIGHSFLDGDECSIDGLIQFAENGKLK